MSLQQLRTQPQSTLQKHHFFADCSQMPLAPLGGNVKLTETTAKGITTLLVNGGGTDYYYPYIMMGAGVVNIQTPVRPGTVVVTGQMNGCALDVRLKDGYFSFYHDNNGAYMNAVNNPGIQLCRIEANAYWGGFKMRQYNGAGLVPTVQFICVFMNNVWHVGCSGIMLGFNPRTRKATDIVESFIPLNGKYRGFFNENINLIQR